MRVMFYVDWPQAHEHLDPICNYLKIAEPDWDVFYAGVEAFPWRYDYRSRNHGFDIAITCDEKSACPPGKKLCVFHGLASKGMAYSSAREVDFQNYDGWFAVPSEYYADLLRNLNVTDNKIRVTGLPKLSAYQPRVLFAPTHNRQLSAIPVVRNRIYELDADVKVKLHPWTESDAHPHYIEFKSYYHDRYQGWLIDAIAESDIVIGDLGSAILEAIACGKQTIQVRNPGYERFYEHAGITEEEMFRLPEFAIPEMFSTVVSHFDDVVAALNKVSVLGSPLANVYDFLKWYEKDFVHSR